MAQDKRVVLISGANTGIGLAVAQQLAKLHTYHVVIGSRNAAAGEEAAKSITTEGFSASSVQLELSSDESIAAAVNVIGREFGRLDVLINNAGTLIDYNPGTNREEFKDLSTRELFTRTFTTNLIGAACLTESCVPLLRKSKSARLIFVSSRMGSMSEAKNKWSGFYKPDYKAYDSSKAALNMLALNYARILEDDGIPVNTVCPGLVKTKLTSHLSYGMPTEVGAKRIVELATMGEGGPTATFSDRNGVIPW